MPPVSNVIPFPTRPRTGSAGAPAGSCVRTDHARRFRAAARDAKQQAHSQSFDSVLVEDFYAQPRRLRDLGRAVGELGRRENVGRLVRQLPRDVAGLTQDLPAPGRGLDGRRRSARRRDDHFVERRRSTLASLVAVAAERGEHYPFGCRLNRGSRRCVAADDERDAAGAALPGGKRRGRADLSQALGVE